MCLPKRLHYKYIGHLHIFIHFHSCSSHLFFEVVLILKIKTRHRDKFADRHTLEHYTDISGTISICSNVCNKLKSFTIKDKINVETRLGLQCQTPI